MASNLGSSGIAAPTPTPKAILKKRALFVIQELTLSKITYMGITINTTNQIGNEIDKLTPKQVQDTLDIMEGKYDNAVTPP